MYEDIFTLNLIPEEKKSDTYNIVICSDNRIVDAIFVLMYSFIKNCKRRCHFWILQSRYSESQKKELKLYAEKFQFDLDIIDIEMNKFMNFNIKRLPVETYYYFEAHNVLPNEIDRCLLIDVDTIILKDIANLYDIDFSDKYCAAGNEYENVRYEEYLRIASGKSEVTVGHVYNTENCFNSGVVLLNLDKFRKDNVCVNDFLSVINQSDIGGFFHDQLVLNRFVKGKLKIFPRLYYNASVISIDYYKKCFSKNKDTVHEVYSFNEHNSDYEETIAHFCGVGSIKPWKFPIKIDDNGVVQVLNNHIPAQNRFIKEWWKCALHVPGSVLARLLSNALHNSNTNQIAIKENSYLRELTYWKSYTKIFRTIFENDNDIYALVNFFKANKYKKIAFYASTQVVMALIPFLERYGVTTSYVVENFVNRPEVVKQSFPRNEKNLPHVDAMIVADIMQTTSHVNRIREYVDFPVYSIFDVVEGKTDAKLVSKGVCHKVVRYLLKRFA